MGRLLATLAAILLACRATPEPAAAPASALGSTRESPPGPVVVGIVRTDAAVLGTRAANGDTSAPWEVLEALRKHHDVHEVDAAFDVPGDVDVLVVPQLSSLSQPQLDRVATFIADGGPALLLVDPFPTFDLNIAPLEDANADNHPDAPRPVAPKGNSTRLLADLGVEWTPARVVFDLDNPHPSLREVPPHVVFAGAAGNEDAATQEVDEVVLIYGGELRATGSAGQRFTPLLVTGRKAGSTAYEDMVEHHPLHGVSPAFGVYPTRADVTGRQHVLAARIQAVADGPEVIVVADVDFVADEFFELQRAGHVRDSDLNFDNVTFVMSAIESLAKRRKPRPTPCAGLESGRTPASIRIRSASSESGPPTTMVLSRLDDTWTDTKDEARLRGDLMSAFVGALGDDERRTTIPGDRSTHAKYGLRDPDSLDATASGGARVLVSDASGGCLVDVIVGRPVPGRPNVHYARRPGDAEVLTLRMAGAFPRATEDWLDRSVPSVDPTELVRLTYDPYRVDEETGSLRDQNPMVFVRADRGGVWAAAREGESVDPRRVEALVKAMTHLEAITSRPRPRDLIESNQRGLYPGRDGALFGANGALQATTADGVVISILFGKHSADLRGRYVLLQAEYRPEDDRSAHRTGPPPGQARADRLDAAYSRNIVVLSNATLQALHPDRASLRGGGP